jgi:hypothetical protein
MKLELEAKKVIRKPNDPNNDKQSIPEDISPKKSDFPRFLAVSETSTIKSKASCLTNDFQFKEPVIDQSRSTGKSIGSFGDKKLDSPIQKKEMKSPLERKRTRSWNFLPKGKKTPLLPNSKTPVKKLATTGPITKQKMNRSLKKTGTLKSPFLRKQTTIKPA